jgi:uncharacterized protein
MIVVSNAGPMIALARIDRLDLLQSLYGQLSIPPGVKEEVVDFGQGLAGAVEVDSAEWIEAVDVHNQTAVNLLREQLDAGESQAIVLAIELHATLLLIDEARGRRIAQAQGLNVTGTVGTLVAAKRRGLIEAVTPLLDKLVAAGFYMSGELHRTAQVLAGEGEK